VSTLPTASFPVPGPLSSDTRPQQISSSLMNTIVQRMLAATEITKKMDQVLGRKEPTMVDGANYGLPGMQFAKKVVDGDFPMFSFQHPEKGRRYGLYVKWEGTAQLPKWRVFWRDSEPSGIDKVLSSITSLFARIVDVVKEVVEAVADMACGLVNNPGAATAAAGAATSPGIGVAAGVGVGIAQGMCAKPPPPPVPIVGGDGMGTVVMIGAGVLVLAAIVKKKRSK